MTRPLRHIVLLHGYGARGRDLGPLARSLTAATGLPASTPDAPHAMPGGQGRCWFPLDGITEENRADRVAQTLPQVIDAIRRHAESTDGRLDDVAIGGFSQGAIVSLELLASALPLGAVLAFSGRLAAQPSGPLDPDIPVLVAHGAADPVIAPDHALRTTSWLQEAGLAPHVEIEPALGHAIGRAGLAAAIATLGARSRAPQTRRHDPIPSDPTHNLQGIVR